MNLLNTIIASGTTKGYQLVSEEESGVGTSGPIQCRQRLGRMLNYYYREAA